MTGNIPNFGGQDRKERLESIQDRKVQEDNYMVEKGPENDRTGRKSTSALKEELTATFLEQEGQLVHQILNGDIEAIGGLYDLYASSVYRYFLKGTRGDQGEAENLTSEVFLRAMEKLKQGRYKSKGTPFGFYLFKIAHNTLLEWWNGRHKGVKGVSLDDPDNQLFLTDTQDILEMIIVQEQRHRIWQLVATLPHVEQEIIVLHYIYKCTFTEIARRLSLPSDAAARMRHQRAKVLLKKLWQNIQKD